MAVGGPVLPEDAHLLPVRARVDPDRRLRDLHDLRDRELDRDRVRAVVLERVSTGFCGQRNRVERVERPQPGEVEDRTEVDEERVVSLAGEDLHAVADRVHGDLQASPVSLRMCIPVPARSAM